MTALLPIIAFAKTWWKAIVGVIVVAPLIFFLGQCRGEKLERNAWEARAAQIRLAAEKVQRAADEVRRAAETVDRARIARNRQEVEDALRDIPDQATSPRQRARACLELRRQGLSSPDIDAACGPARPPGSAANPS